MVGRGQTNRGMETNWRNYTSSSKELNRRISERSKDDFAFVILEYYSTFGGLSFAETWTQVTCETPARNGEFMNRFIDKVTWKVTEPVTTRHKRRLSRILRQFPFHGEGKDNDI